MVEPLIYYNSVTGEKIIDYTKGATVPEGYQLNKPE